MSAVLKELLADDASNVKIDSYSASENLKKGLTLIRANWILERDNTEVLHNPVTADLRLKLTRKPRHAKIGKNVSKMHYARQGDK